MREQSESFPDLSAFRPLIDQLMPVYDAVQRRHIVVDAPADRAFASIWTADIRGTAPMRALFWLRDLPARVRRHGAAPLRGGRLTFAELMGAGWPWVTLAEAPGREAVVGGIGAVWRPEIDWVRFSPAKFTTFAQPGFARIAIAFRVVPVSAERCVVHYEARTAATDPASRRRFLRYWRVVGPFAGYVMAGALRAIKAEAELPSH